MVSTAFYVMIFYTQNRYVMWTLHTPHRLSQEKLVSNRPLLNKHRFNHYLWFNNSLNDLRGFSPYVNELKNHVFRFKRGYITDAQRRLGNVLSVDTSNSDHNGTARTIVSIHLRLGDYGNHLKRRFGLPVVPDNYFTRAMQFITEIDSVSV